MAMGGACIYALFRFEAILIGFLGSTIRVGTLIRALSPERRDQAPIAGLGPAPCHEDRVQSLSESAPAEPGPTNSFAYRHLMPGLVPAGGY